MGNTISAVIVSWNKKNDLRKNLNSLLKQTRKFDEIIVVDSSSDGTQEMIKKEFPTVNLIVPKKDKGAIASFNLGFSKARSEYVAILDDDVTISPKWVRDIMNKFDKEPRTTALISTKVVEPGMPKKYIKSKKFNEERYLSTFRGCGSVAKKSVIKKAGYYDASFLIYVNERDLTCRVLNLGYRILNYPKVITYHAKPFGVRGNTRSLFYHVRNYNWYVLKNVPFSNMILLPFRMVLKIFLKNKKQNDEFEAVGTIGIKELIRKTDRAYFIIATALLASLLGVPRCLKKRKACKAEDFRSPF